MRAYRTIFFFLFFLSCFSTTSEAQTDSLKRTDSANAAQLQQYNLRIGEIDRQRLEDSIKRAALENELNALRTSDNRKKAEVEAQLLQLNEKELNRLNEKKARIDSLRKTAKSFPVEGMVNDTLFLIYNRLGSFSAQNRAEAIAERIKNLSENFKFSQDSLKIIEGESTTDLQYGDAIIMSISENDALWNNTTREELAKRYQAIIGRAITGYRSETSLITLAKEFGLAFLVLLVLGVIIFYSNRLFKWLSEKMRAQEGRRIRGIKLKEYTLLDAGRQVDVLAFLMMILKWMVILLLIYITLPIVFGIFPWTKNFADTLFGFVLTPLKKIASAIWNYLPDLFTVIVIVIVFRYFLKGIHFLKTEIENGKLKISGFYPDWANPTYQIVRVLLFAFLFIVVFPYLPGSDSPVFKGVSVFLGVLFTFGSSGSLSNIIAGLVLTYMRSFKIGDRVRIGEVTGDIIEKSMLVTRVRTIKNEIVSVPNSNVMNSHTINYSSDSLDKGLILHTTVTIGYDVPWKKIHQALLNAAARTDCLLAEPKPFVLQTSLDDFYVSYQVNAYTRDPNKQATIYSELHQHIQDCCYEAGIEILSPHFRAARDGNAAAIPPDYLPKDYTAPGFKVTVEKKGDG